MKLNSKPLGGGGGHLSPARSLLLLFLVLVLALAQLWPRVRFSISDTHSKGSEWVDSNCFKPLTRPIVGEYKKWDNNSNNPPKIVNVGFPKIGSSTLKEFLSSSSYNVSHFWPCGGKGECGRCMQQAINKSLPPFAYCGNYAAYTQMDSNWGNKRSPGGKCIYPQISYLKEIYDEDPSAIFLLPFRNVTAWIRSLSNWNRPTLRQRMTEYCEFPEYNFTLNMGKEDRELEDLFCRHVHHIRQFVSQRPNLTLVEYSIDGEGVGDYLASLLPHMNLNGSKYGHKNKSYKLQMKESHKR